jgi:anti-anti-sigma factor
MFRTLLRRWSIALVSATPTANDRAMAEPAPTLPYPPRWSPHAIPQLEVTIDDHDDEVVVHLEGEGGFLESEMLDAALTPLRARRLALVTFDLSELRSLTSMLLGVLIGFHFSTVHGGGRMRLTALRPEVFEVIERARLTKLFEIHEVVDGRTP